MWEAVLVPVTVLGVFVLCICSGVGLYTFHTNRRSKRRCQAHLDYIESVGEWLKESAETRGDPPKRN